MSRPSRPRRRARADAPRGVAGLGAGTTEAVAVVCPMEVVKIRLQAQMHSMSDPLDIPKCRSTPLPRATAWLTSDDRPKRGSCAIPDPEGGGAPDALPRSRPDGAPTGDQPGRQFHRLHRAQGAPAAVAAAIPGRGAAVVPNARPRPDLGRRRTIHQRPHRCARPLVPGSRGADG